MFFQKHHYVFFYPPYWDKFWTGGLVNLLSLQEEFAPYRGSSTGVVARVEGLRGRMSEAGRQASW